MFEAGLSFLGLGVQPPDPSLGRMINEGKDYVMTAPFLFIVLLYTIFKFLTF